MSIDIYPAHLVGNEINHADDWNEDSTMNLANGNFYALVQTLGLTHLMGDHLGHIRVKSLKMALQTSEETRYHKRLHKLCAIADIRRAPFIAFS